MLPKFERNGNLPKGIHKATLEEIMNTFGTSSAKRKWLIRNLEEIIKLVKSTSKLERVIIWGSFVSNKELPQDIDLLLIMSVDFNKDNVKPDARKIFNYNQGKLTLDADIFRTKSSIGNDTINLWLETYQMARNFEERGIVEVIIND